MKTCFKCGESKSLDEFYKHPQMADGRLGKCKTCTIKDSETRRALKSSDPQWVVSELKRHREKSQKYREDGRHKPDPQRSLNWADRNPTKRHAHHMVNNAVRNGKLVKLPCSVCGNPKSEAHHEDYSKPLDVIWLCRKHHGELHHQKTVQRILGQTQTA